MVGPGEGLQHASVVNLDHVQTVDESRLSRFVGSPGADGMKHVCRALAIATGCSP